jgi:polyisoprenoid-binding protein YceI
MSTVQETQTLIPAGTWSADRAHSSVQFAVRHMKIVTVRGRFLDFEATLEGGEQPVLHGAIRTASASTDEEQRDGHLNSPDFFDVERYPEATIDSVSIEPGRVVADLTLRGITRPIELEASFLGPDTDPWGNERLGVQLDGEIDRTQFGIVWNAPLPGGDSLLDDTVKLSAQISFVRQAG